MSNAMRGTGEFEDKSYIAFVTADGVEATKDGVLRDGTVLFYDTEFYRKASDITFD